MIALLLIQKIASLFLIMAVGFTLVRTGILQSNQSAVLSKLMLFTISPAAIISAFQVELTAQVMQGFFVTLGIALCVQVSQILIVQLAARPLRLSGLEKMTCVYSNTFNLILPLVGFCLGDEWCIYALAYMGVQSLFMWTHGKSLIAGTTHIEIRKLITDLNLIALAVGFAMFVSGIRLGGPLLVFVDDMGKMIGPVAMLITGMIVGGMELPQIVTNKRVWLVVFVRLVALPALCCAALHFLAGSLPIANAQNVMLILLLGAITPTASMSVVFSQEYGTEAPYASAINIVSTLSCIVTMPLWVFLFML